MIECIQRELCDFSKMVYFDLFKSWKIRICLKYVFFYKFSIVRKLKMCNFNYFLLFCVLL